MTSSTRALGALAWGSLALLSACKGRPDKTQDTLPAPAPPAFSVAPPPEIMTSASTSSLPSKAPSGWPAGTGKVKLTWVVHPAVPRGSSVTRHLELVVSSGDVARSISIDGRGSVFFAIDMQPRCSTQTKRVGPRVAELFMNGGGNLVYTVERTSPELLEVFENVSSDGLCTDARGREMECPVTRARIESLAVPPEATFVETFHEVTREDTDAGAGTGAVRERAIDCTRE